MDHTRPRLGRRVAVAVALASVLPVTGCNSGSPAGSPTTAPHVGASRPRTPTVALRVVRAHGEVLVVAPVTIKGHGPYPFVVDSGAARSVVDTSVARSAGLTLGHSGRTVSGVTCTSRARPTKLTRWSAGTVRLPAVTADVIRLPASERRAGIRGLVGSDVLSRFGTVTVDYAGHHLVLGSVALSLHGVRHSVHLKVVHHDGATLALAPVTVAGHGPLVGIVDTGAARSAVSRAVARRAHLSRVRRTEVSGVACSATVTVVRVTRWRVGATPLPATTVTATRLSGSARPHLAALVGSDVLSSFGAIAIDYHRQRLFTGSPATATQPAR